MGRMRRRMGLRASWCDASRKESMFLSVSPFFFFYSYLPFALPFSLHSLSSFFFDIQCCKDKVLHTLGWPLPTLTAMAGSTAWPTASPASASASTTRTHVRSRIASFRCGVSAVCVFFFFKFGSLLSPPYTLLPVDLFSPYLPISPPSPHLLLPFLFCFPSSHHLTLLSSSFRSLYRWHFPVIGSAPLY
ncbi:hypothetical protein K438DRAFT_193903 [Mycena galopus ATCC 62051]|nr:hypothetical protein K438DRAFT_193903 [Mycena galopus ATCC 62051]